MNRPARLQHSDASCRYVVVTTSQQPGTGAHQYPVQQPYIPAQSGPYGQFQQPAGSPPPAPTPTKRSSNWPWIAGIIVAFLLGTAIGGASGGSTSTPTAAPASPVPSQTAPVASAPPVSSAPAAPVVPSAPAGPVTEVEDGTYQVGTDMVAGRYKTAGPPAGSAMPMCYFARSKDDSGELGSIIANDIAQGPSSVTVKAGEFVKLSGGCTWTKQ